MAGINIRVEGLDKALNKTSPQWVKNALNRAMQRSVLLLQARMADYPPPRPDSKYTRKGLLGRSWTTKTEVWPTGVVGKVGNRTKYAPWVQSDAWQAWMHRGWWTNTDAQVLKQELVRIEGFFKATLALWLK